MGNRDMRFVNRISPVAIPPGSVFNQLVPSAVQGGELTLSPHNKVVVTGSYQLPLPEGIGAVSVSATDAYTSAQLASAGSPFGVLPSYNILNANLNWNGLLDSRFDASLFVTNALQRHYETYVDGLYTSVGAEFRNLGYPRMFGARLRYSFRGT